MSLSKRAGEIRELIDNKKCSEVVDLILKDPKVLGVVVPGWEWTSRTVLMYLGNYEEGNMSAEDWTRWNPWRAPGNAPVYDPCGRAGGAGHPTPGHGEFTNTTYAKFGDLGSKVLPKYPTGTVWEAGSSVTTMQSIRANHGGGYQYRSQVTPRETT